jgi:hypothetical protein
LIQVEAAPYVGSDSFVEAGDPADRAGFRLQRARFGFAGRAFDALAFELDAEHAYNVDAVMTLHDAWFGYERYDFLRPYVGLQDVPFSRFALVNAADGALADRPLAVQAMAPFHQLGATIRGELWHGQLGYQLGVFNGLERNDNFFQGYVENAAILGNRFDGLTYAARLTSAQGGSLGRTVADLGRSPLRWAVGASTFYSDGGTRSILGLGADALVHARGFYFAGEFLANRTTPKETPTQPTTQAISVTSIAAVGEAGYTLWRNRVVTSARFEWIDPDTSVKNEQDCWLLTGGVSYHVLHDVLSATLQYTHREELHGKSLANDNLLLQLQLAL